MGVGFEEGAQDGVVGLRGEGQGWVGGGLEVGGVGERGGGGEGEGEGHFFFFFLFLLRVLILGGEGRGRVDYGLWVMWLREAELRDGGGGERYVEVGKTRNAVGWHSIHMKCDDVIFRLV